MARLERAEQDIQRLADRKADAKDVARLADEFSSLRRTLQWFMGIMVIVVLALPGIVALVLG